MNMFKMCLNWKVLAGLAVVGVGIFLVAPGLALAALPLLLLAACPLSMLLMMKSMGGMQGTQQNAQQAGAVAASGTQYTCSMHPDARADQPGRCPRCGMALVPAGAAPQPAAVAAVAAAEPGVGVSRETQLGLLRAQLQVLNEQQAALAARLTDLQQAGPAAPEAPLPSTALEEAERVAQRAADRQQVGGDQPSGGETRGH